MITDFAHDDAAMPGCSFCPASELECTACRIGTNLHRLSTDSSSSARCRFPEKDEFVEELASVEQVSELACGEMVDVAGESVDLGLRHLEFSVSSDSSSD